MLQKVVMNSGQLDFVKINSISLTTSVFMQCLLWFNTPVFPVDLLDQLSKIQIRTQKQSLEKQAEAFRLALDGKAVSPHLLSLLGLFNLILLYSDSNKVTLGLLSEMFAPLFVDSKGSRTDWRADIPKAQSVLRALIVNVYQIFPSSPEFLVRQICSK